MKTPLLASFAALSIAPLVVATVGCYDSDFCEFVKCEGASASTASGPPVSEQCNPLDAEKYAPTADCGVFVRAGATGKGTPDDPMGTLDAAFALQRKALYVCEGTYAGSVELPAGTTVFGGLSCDAWAYQASVRSVVAGVANQPALIARSGDASTVYNLEIVAPDATDVDAMEGYGASSIAVLARASSNVTFTDCKLVSGNGAAGRAGADLQETMAATGGLVGQLGTNGCDDPSSHIGGDGGVIVCTDVTVSGGRGGLGENMPNADGQMGNPGLPDGKGGAGGSGEGASKCNPGLPGSSGDYGMAGVITDAMGDATDSGYLPARATSGGPGGPGGGGGGGGGSKRCLNGSGGASGGGGGSGGCGGRGAESGGAGGWSIGILGVDATIAIGRSEIVTGNGGAGGVGGRGQRGGAGAMGGAGGTSPDISGNDACIGGLGGDGGQGGPGAGGQGGSSIGILYKTVTEGRIPTNRDTSFTVGEAGGGGLGALNGVSFTMGPDGLAGLKCIALALGSDRMCDQ